MPAINSITAFNHITPSYSRIPISFPSSLFHRSRFSLSALRIFSENMLPELQDFGFFRRVIIVTLFLAALLFSCFVLYRAAESAGFNMSTSYYSYYTRNHPQMTTDILPEDSLPLVSSLIDFLFSPFTFCAHLLLFFILSLVSCKCKHCELLTFKNYDVLGFLC